MFPRVKKASLFLCCLLAAWGAFCSCGGVQTGGREVTDSLNRQVYRQKYSSLEQAMATTEKALARAREMGYQDGVHEALLNKGDVYGMRMDYDSAQACYLKVLDESDNDLLRGIADVDMMAVCLMRSMSKEFYDYRSDAEERFAHIREESGEMSPHQMVLWQAVQTEYRFVSVNYFMKMRQDEGVAEEFSWLEQHQDLFVGDTIQQSAYLFLQAMHWDQKETDDVEEAADAMQRSLVRLLSMSKTRGYVYYEALALNALSRVLLSGLGMKSSRRVLVGEMIGEDGDDSLACRLVDRAGRLARQYGNAFLETSTLLTRSDYYLKEGRDSMALAQMELALALVNAHHERMARTARQDGGGRLVAYEEAPDSLSTEMRWIADPSVVAVPDWMAGIREQLSIIYGAMGRKAESDYNHNIYFDILDATRQDLRVQQEENHLKREERMLNLLLLTFVVVIAVLVWALIIYNRRSGREYRKKVEMLGRVMDICKRLSAAMPDEMEDEEGLEEILHGVSDEEVAALFPRLAGRDWTKVDTRELKGLDRELLNVLLVFYAWMRQQGVQYLGFVEQKRRLESETFLFEKRLEDNKRQHLEKQTALSIVHGITPFLDRALREVGKLAGSRNQDPETVRGRLLYLGELVDKINDYNEVLGNWVKIRQGVVSLNLENFALQPLFDTLRHGEKTFASRGITLKVWPTDAVVKGDKSLTLFMMNTLLDNARKYTPQGGRVSLAAEEAEHYVEISVCDTGFGLSATDVDTLNHSKVYDSSKLGVTGEHATELQERKGFGFGLMNCKGIIGRYKKLNKVFSVCEFGVESEMEKGSRFFFRLPKGVLKTLSCLAFCLVPLTASAVGEAPSAELLLQAHADSVYAANVRGDYAQAILYADSAIQCLNASYLCHTPGGERLMVMEGGDMAELEWWKEGFDTDYELIIRLRNEIAIAALALNRNALYHYNNEVFTRLYIQTSTDPTLEEYCNDIKMANRNKKTLVILLGMLSLLGLVVYFFMYYRHHQLFIFNLRQLVQLYTQLFSSAAPQRLQVLHQGLSDIKPANVVGLMLPTVGGETIPPSVAQHGAQRFVFTGEEMEHGLMESLMNLASTRQEPVVGEDGHFHAYPLFVEGEDRQKPVGVLGVRFTDTGMTKEETLIVNLVVQFVSILSYFSYLKVDEMDELLALKKDERERLNHEQQKVYVRNQILDNTLSALKHETMYYPTRIKQLVDAALDAPDGAVDEAVVDDIAELLSYYKGVFTLLSTCASKPGETTLFRRTRLSVQTVGKMVRHLFDKQQKKTTQHTRLRINAPETLTVQGDEIYLHVLIQNIISLYGEHRSGGDLQLDIDGIDGFVRFCFTDARYRYGEEEIPQLFYVDNIRYDARTDTLTGAQYLICRQIIREHDAHASRRGCRIYVENGEDGQGSRFVFTLPRA